MELREVLEKELSEIAAEAIAGNQVIIERLRLAEIEIKELRERNKILQDQLKKSR